MCLCLCVGAARAAGEADERLALARAALPSAPITSKDGSIVVYAPASKAGYRAPVLVFVDRAREELARTTRLKLAASAGVLEVAIGGKSDGDTRVLATRYRDREGGLRERIELPDPEAADLAAFRRAVCEALLRAWMAENGGGAEAVERLPAWLIGGVVRYMDRETRQADADRMLLLWSHACLPAAAELFASDSLAASREPAVAAMLASWLLERRQSASPFEALLRAVAGGEAWQPRTGARLLTGGEDLAALDAAVDRWMLSERRVVVKPGTTTDGVVRRFRSHLLLYPSDCGKRLDLKRPGLTFEEAIACADDADVRRCASAAVQPLRAAAMGRDGTLLAVADAYVSFLQALARGAKREQLGRLLAEAESLRQALEARTARGETLQREAGEG